MKNKLLKRVNKALKDCTSLRYGQALFNEAFKMDNQAALAANEKIGDPFYSCKEPNETTEKWINCFIDKVKNLK